MANVEKQEFANQCLSAAKNQSMDNVVVYVDETNKITGLADFEEFARRNDFDTAKAAWNFQDGERTGIATVDIFPSLFTESDTPVSVITDLLREEAANDMFFTKYPTG